MHRTISPTDCPATAPARSGSRAPVRWATIAVVAVEKEKTTPAEKTTSRLVAPAAARAAPPRAATII